MVQVMDHLRERERKLGWRGWLCRFWKETRAQDLVEYALLLVLLCTASVAMLDRFACELSCVFDLSAQAIEKARGNIPPGQQLKCRRGCS